MSDTTAQIFALIIAIAIFSAMIDEEYFFNTLRAMHGDPERRERITRAIRPHFHLVRYFTVIGLLTISLIALTLIYFERGQLELLKAATAQQSAARAAQVDALETGHRALTRKVLLDEREARHRTAAQLLILALGEKALSALSEQARAIPVEACREISADQDVARQECHQQVLAKLHALSGHAALNMRLVELGRASGLDDLQVIDRRGLTLLSINPERLGEDHGSRAQFQQVVQSGGPRGLFNTPESNDGMLRSLLPYSMPGSVLVLIEIGTPRASDAAALPVVAGAGVEVEAEMARSSRFLLTTVIVLMVVLFGVLFMLVRRADLLSRQREQELIDTEEKLAVTTLIANSSHLDPAMASEISYGLGAALRQIQAVQHALIKALPAFRVTSAISRVIMASKSEQLVFNVEQARKQFSQVADSELDIQGLNPLLDSAQAKIAQVAEMIELDQPRRPVPSPD